MGVIRRQSIKRTSVSYLGVLIGTISVLKIYPLNFEIYGMSQFIIACATLIIPFASLGISRLTIRYFPDFKDEKSGHHGFLGFLLILTISFFVLFFLLFSLFETPFFGLLELLNMKKDVFWENRGVILLVSFALIINSILGQFASNFKRVVIPEVFNNLLIKLALPTLVLFYFYKYITEDEFRYLYAFSYFVALVGLAGYLIFLGQFNLRIDFAFIKRPLFQGMMVYSLFNALSIIGNFFSFRIDSIMITSFLEYDNTGHYSFFSYLVGVIAIPYMSMVAISSPIIAHSLKEADLSSVGKLYRQSSETLFIIGLFIIGGAWLCMDPLLEITGKASVLHPLKSTFLFLAAGQLINVTTGLTEPIIGYSKYYRFNFYTMAVLAILNVLMNLYFIPRFGIIGAAMATAISLMCYNSIQSVFIYLKFKILPFSRTHLAVAIITAFSFTLANLLNFQASALILIIIRGSVFAVLFILILVLSRASSDVNSLWQDLMTRILKIFGNKGS